MLCSYEAIPLLEIASSANASTTASNDDLRRASSNIELLPSDVFI